jgi:Mg-chelatase subunit ChlD
MGGEAMQNRYLAVAMACGLVVACSAEDGGTADRGAPNTGGDFGNAPASSPGAFGNANTAGQSGAGMTPMASQGTPAQGCAMGNARATRVKPTVYLVIDGSGSMTDNLGGTDRWSALRSALMDPDGVVPTLQSVVEFGMVLYDGAVLGGVADLLDAIIPGLGAVIPQAGGEGCPRIITIDPTLDNFAALDQAYPAMPLGGSTPTHSALQSVMDNVTMQVENAPDQDIGPQYVVLATDGEPNDLCSGDLALDVRPGVIAAVEQGAAAGVKTFVISLAGQDAALQAHLEQVAAAGNTGQAPFTPTSKDDLVAVLTEIIGGAVTCAVRLNGEVDAGAECRGTVEVNGNALPCNDPNGWRLLDASTIELTGQACDDFRVNPDALLRADFPCGVFRPE